jgi:hypothetical protein
MTSLFSIPNCPSITIPCGFTKSGLPVGLQIAAAPFADEFALAAAASLDRIRLPAAWAANDLVPCGAVPTIGRRKQPITPVRPRCQVEFPNEAIKSIGPRSCVAAAYHHAVSVVQPDWWRFVVALGIPRFYRWGRRNS